MYKYQPWSLGNEDCFSWPTKTSTTNYYSKPWNNYYKIEDDKAWTYKGEDMITVKVDYNAYSTNVFNIAVPKFDTGMKIKFWDGLDMKGGVINWKQGVIYSINKKVTISKTSDANYKGFKADNVQWHYVIIESGNLKTWNGIKEDNIKIDDTPDYNKYFDLMSRCGMDFKRDQYTIISWNQYEATESTYSYGHRGYVTEVALKPKINDKVTNLKFWVNSGGKLPAISEKC